MTPLFSLAGPPVRIYSRSTAAHSLLDAAVWRATRNLARRDSLARELSDLARWEGEGGGRSR